MLKSSRVASPLALAFLVGCGGSGTTAETPPEATADPIVAAPDVSATATATASATAAPQSSARSGDHSQDVSIGSGTAGEVNVTTDAGVKVSLGPLSYKEFSRSSAGIPSTEIPTANVSFATLESKGVGATDISCNLPPWPEAGGGVEAVATNVVALALQDAVLVAAVLKAKPELLACSGKKPLRLVWSFENGRVTAASAAGVDQACVDRAMKQAVAFRTGRCAATMAP